MEWLQQLDYWHWLTIGLLLLIIEILSSTEYLLWLGLSALITAAVTYLFSIGWQVQCLTFGSFSFFTSWICWRIQLKRDTNSDKNRLLNQKDKQLLGTIIHLDEAVQPGACRVRIGDTTWPAITAQAFPSGTLVKVVKVDGIQVTIEQAIIE